MRNLKKILALALALVMTLSVMSVANAFTDDGSFTAEYTEAAEVLAGLGVYQGYDDGSFQPQSDITRAEVAAVIYRIATGDVDDEQADLYADYNKFDDVTSDKWYAGYVNYCANAEYIKGYDSSTFGPKDSVTGYQVLAMILRVVGYDANDEFTGPDWQVKVASTAKELGITDTIVAGTLGQAATREVVGELLFRTLVYVPVVKYTIAKGYEPITTIAAVDVVAGTTTVSVTGQTLGMKVFGLKQTNRMTIDSWGRPGYYWYCNKSSNTRTILNTVATIEEAPLAIYTEAVTPSTLVTDAFGRASAAELRAWVNANELAATYTLYASDSVTSVGAQGRLTEVYEDRIVMIDTMLATVSSVTSVVYNSNGSVKTPAAMKLTVYDGIDDGVTSVTLKSNSNFTYTAGSMILVHVKTTDTTIATGTTTTTYANTIFGEHGVADDNVCVPLGVAESFTGAQTLIYYNKDQHQVNGAVYQDANCFHLDQAGTSTANHTWYLDQYGNLIGAADIATIYSYGTIESIVWSNTGTLSKGYALADLVLMNGDVLSNVTIKAIGDATNSYITPDSNGNLEPTALTNADQSTAVGAVSLTDGTVSTTMQNNWKEYRGLYLYQIEQNADGSYNLYAVANTAVPYGTAKGARLGTDVTVTSKISKIVKGNTGASSDAADIVTDSNTVYLIRNTGTNTFSSVTGFNNIDTYVGATVDYVLGADGRAAYVYIEGVPASAKTSGLFYAADEDVNYTYYPEDDIYVINGIFNGESGRIVVDGSATGLKFTNLSDKTDTLGAEAFVKRLVNHANTYHSVYEVKLENGYVIAADAINKTGESLNDETGYLGVYNGLMGIRYKTSAKNYGYYSGDVLSIGGVNYNVTTSTKFIIDGETYYQGQIADGTVFSNNIIHVVYDNKDDAQAYEVYVYSAATGDVYEDPDDPGVTYSYWLEQVTMDYSSGATIVIGASTGADELKDTNTTVTLYNKDGSQVYTTKLTVTVDGTKYTLTAAVELSKGTSYYARITLPGGQTLVTPLIEAQTTVTPAATTP